VKTLLKVIGIICVVGAFASFFFCISFYYRGFPSMPQPEFGRIYAINNHGFPLYLTKKEELEQTWSFAVAAVLFASGVIIDRFFDPFNKHKQEVPRIRAPWNHRWGP
jgi:hypothetical protein